MTADPQGNSIAARLGQWAGDIVCPACRAELRFSDVSVVCTGCGRNYPVVDGIPVLIVQRGSLPSAS